MTRGRVGLVAASLAAILCCGAAGATNLVANGGFESGAFAPWTAAGADIDTAFSNTGAYDAVFDGLPDGNISQALATEAGQAYKLTFALLDTAGSPEDKMTVSLGTFSQVLTGLQAGPPGDLPSFYTQEMFFIPGSDIGGSETLSFQSAESVGQFHLDDVSLVPSTVPETPAWVTILLGFGTLGMALRNRRAIA